MNGRINYSKDLKEKSGVIHFRNLQKSLSKAQKVPFSDEKPRKMWHSITVIRLQQIKIRNAQTGGINEDKVSDPYQSHTHRE